MKKALSRVFVLGVAALVGCAGGEKIDQLVYKNGCTVEGKILYSGGFLTPSIKQPIVLVSAVDRDGNPCNFVPSNAAATPGASGIVGMGIVRLGEAAIATQYPTSSFDVDVSGTATGTGGDGGSARSEAHGGRAAATQHQSQVQKKQKPNRKQNYGW